MSAEGDRYRADVKVLPCEICVEFFGVDPEPQTSCVSDAHHPRAGTGAGRKAPDTDCIALCKEHHQGNTGIHGMGGKAFVRHYGVTEAELTERTRYRVMALRARRA